MKSSNNGQDNMKEFMTYYLNNVRAISVKSIQKIMNLPLGSEEYNDEVILDATICWAVTNNLEVLLALDNVSNVCKASDMISELEKNRLLIVHQDRIENGIELGQDHWFAVIGDHGSAHIVEYLPHACPSVYTDTIESIVHLLSNIEQGLAPDRFSNEVGEHKFTARSFSRLPLIADTITKLLT